MIIEYIHIKLYKDVKDHDIDLLKLVTSKHYTDRKTDRQT